MLFINHISLNTCWGKRSDNFYRERIWNVWCGNFHNFIFYTQITKTKK